MAQGKITMINNGSTVGVVCEDNRLILTWIKGGDVKKSICADLGDNIIDGSNIKSHHLFASFLKETLKEHGISAKFAAYAIPGELVFTRNVRLPRMSEEQLRINIPFEFRDFIQGELKEYVFDYAYIPDANKDTSHDDSVKLFLAAIPRSYLEEITETFRMAGLKLVKAAPEFCTYESLIRLLMTKEEREKERCFLDIGRSNSRMMIFKDGHYKLMHLLDVGMRQIVMAIADEMNVDEHLASTYLDTKYEGCDKLPEVEKVYKKISIEVLKGINFYEVSDVSARLEDMTLCGGGATVEPLVELLKKRVTLNVTTMNELLPAWNSNGDLNITGTSLGIVVE